MDPVFVGAMYAKQLLSVAKNDIKLCYEENFVNLMSFSIKIFLKTRKAISSNDFYYDLDAILSL